jgi:hypothetical protein
MMRELRAYLCMAHLAAVILHALMLDGAERALIELYRIGAAAHDEIGGDRMIAIGDRLSHVDLLRLLLLWRERSGAYCKIFTVLTRAHD